MEVAAKDLIETRRAIFSIAYRMLGSVAEAEDIVQESFLRLERARSEGTVVESVPAFLATVATRLSIDHLRSARVRREAYVGEWLPEPLTADDRDVTHRLEAADSISMAFLVILETLSPVERAVFLLREVFDYGYDEISGIVGKSKDNCRQILARARQHVDERRPRFEPSAEERDVLARRFFEACQEGDVGTLVELLASDVSFHGDGGGKAVAVARAMNGRDRVAALLRGIFSKGKLVGGRVALTEVNGQPGAMLLDGEGLLVAVMSLEIAGGEIQAIRTVVNPDKLHHLGSLSALGLVRSRRDASADA
jgi:RNA polymerase sigma-70 factor (ECF subfamily)